MNPERKIDPEKIHVVNITTIKGSIEASEDSDQNSIAGHHFKFELGTGYDIEEKIVGVQIVVNIDAVDDKEDLLPVKGSYTHEVVMKVENLDDFVEVSKKGDHEESIKIDGLLGATLVGIAFSTIRGVIYIRTQGTSLGTVILPVVDPKNMIESLH